MKKVMRLVSVQLWAVLGDMLSIGNNKKKKPKALFAGIVMFVVAMSCISFFYSFMIGSGLRLYHSIEVLPPMMMAVTCAILLMTTILKVKGTIFGFKDYDMVMSLPISTGGIVASRLIILYVVNMLFVTMLIVPMMIAYGILARPSAMFYLLGFIAMLFIPFVPIVIASFIGTVIAYVASKFRYSNFLNIIFTMGLLIAIIGLSFTIEDNGQELANVGKAMATQVNSLYPLAKMYTLAVVEYDIFSFFLFVGISVFAFVLYTALVKLVFKKMNTVMMTGRSRVNYKMGKLKTASPLKALYSKELKRYFSSPLYVLNTGFGIVMLTLAAIAMIFVDPQKILGGAMPTSVLAMSGPMFISFCVVMSSTTASSISLEGKNLWILKSLPVEPRTIYLSKIAVNLTVLSPTILDAALIGILLHMGFLQTLCMILITIVCAVFISFYGLLINLFLPNFSWSNEVVVIKQSAAAMIAIFTGMGIVAIQFAFMMVLPSAIMAYSLYILLIVALDIALYLIITSYGKKRFATLS